MHREEICRCIERALTHILSERGALPDLSSSDSQQLAENINLLAKILADQLWIEGYELRTRYADGRAHSSRLSSGAVILS